MFRESAQFSTIRERRKERNKNWRLLLPEFPSVILSRIPRIPRFKSLPLFAYFAYFAVKNPLSASCALLLNSPSALIPEQSAGPHSDLKRTNKTATLHDCEREKHFSARKLKLPGRLKPAD